ncbi:tRNA(Met) cytidine acetyltransferase TmcA [Halobellus limi]|uniref:tRNA(Met) cytidine acetyltransferase TmcA n=1 Tax=Halobellus limi TaxID=699433 RepID=A0A1H5U2H4_9EURY|nr:tRNA(Met) cytidine acetyltransferase TmcA [Halobellus limi]QCC47159.1 tRNA(Met) cytidine acetyltransferase [Halobellus limi]SEF69332.1 tRNA(Met) cytidine acetyltransferase [Halobellus limi]
MNVAALAADLRAAARRSDHRRLLVLAGERDAGVDAAFDAVEGAAIPDEETTIVTTAEGFRFERVAPNHARELLGTTRTAVIYDAHEDFSPNALGRLVGTVDGGGLFVLLAPPLDDWPDRPGSFESSLAVPPYAVDDVGGRFRERLVGTLRDHPGVAIVDVDAGTVERRGDADASAPARSTPSTPPAGTRRFPAAAYEACLTADQSRALHALEALEHSVGGTDGEQRDAEGEADEGRRRAVVVEADRGRGKSSAAGLAAGSLAAAGRDVLVTAPDRRNASDLFSRASELLSALDALGDERSGDGPLRARSGGRIRFAPPAEAAELPDDPDVVLVDEAAALPVRLLSSFLDGPAVAFFTTVHGYEGAGRGFSVRFRDELDGRDHDVTEVTLSEPIRFAPADPVESWAFRALLLDARPPVEALVADASPSSVDYRALSPEELAADEHLLREVFGLLVLAHYRTEPDDLARLLDAPNLRVRVLEHEGHVVSVALLAREGGLDAETRRSMYEGARVRGNMLPDVFTSQLRDEEAGVPVGYRVVRIATHHAARSRGLGSTLLSEVRTEFDGDADYLGVGYGATPDLLSFWESNGYETVHLSTTRNESSGEYSALMLDPLSEVGRALCDRHARWFRDRIGDLLAEHLRDADPDVVRGALAACEAPLSLDLSDYEWRVVVGVAFGPGQYATAPRAFRRLALAALVGAGEEGEDGPDGEPTLTPREERLLVRKVLQTRPADAVADELGYVSARQCLRALGDAYGSLVERYGGTNEVVATERERFGE